MANTFLSHKEKDNNIYEDDSNWFSVDKLLKCRTKKSKKEYLVQWVGYSSDANSWIPGVDVSPDLKKLFHHDKALAKKERKRKRVSSNQNSSKKVKTGEAFYTKGIEKSPVVVLERLPMSLNENPPKNFMKKSPVVELERLPICLMNKNPLKNVLIELSVSAFYPQPKGHQKDKIQLKAKKQSVTEAPNKLSDISSEISKVDFDPQLQKRQKGQLKAKKESAAKTHNRFDTDKSYQVESIVNYPGSALSREPSQDKENEGVPMPISLPVESILRNQSVPSHWKVLTNSDDEDRDLLGYDEYMKHHNV